MIHDTAPVRLEHVWLWPDGTTAPIVSGGADEGDGGGDAGQEGDAGGDAGQGGESGTGGDTSETFTRAQVDAVAARTRRAVLAELGDVRDKAKRFDELEAANATELDKVTARATAAEAAVQAANERANGILRRSAITVAARDTVDPDAVYEALASDDSITVDDDGTVAGVDEAIAALLERRPYLKAGNGGNAGNNANAGNGDGGKFDGGARGGSGETLTRKQLQTMTNVEVAKLTPEQVAAAMSRP